MHHLAAATALLAAFAAAARGRARAAAVLAGDSPANLELLGHAAGHLGQGELDAGFQIGPARLPAATAEATETAEAAAEDVAEDVAEGREDVADVGEAAAEAAAARSLVAEAIVEAPLLRVGEHLIGLGGLLETRLGFLVARVAVRMQIERELAVGSLQLGGVGVAAHAQDFVVVSLITHGGRTVGYPKSRRLPPCLHGGASRTPEYCGRAIQAP